MRQSVKKISNFSLAQWESLSGENVRNFQYIKLEVLGGNNSSDQFQLLRAETDEGNEEINEEMTLGSDVDIERELIEKRKEEERLEGIRKEAVESTKAELEKSYQDQINQINLQVQQLQENLNLELNKFTEECEKKCLELSLALTKKLLLNIIEINPEYIEKFVKEALTEAVGNKIIKIKVSEKDYQYLTNKQDNNDRLNLTYEIDANIQAGCILVTNFGEVDLVVENMFERFKENILTTLKI